MDKTEPVVLLTGFMPFGTTIKANPSWEVVRNLDYPGTNKLCLPVDFQMPQRLLWREIKRLNPDWVICSGVYFQNDFAIENRLRDCGRARMANAIPAPTDGEYLGRVIKQLNMIYPTVLSTNARAYVCEHIAWWHARLAARYNYRGCFVHVPEFEVCPEKIQKRWWKKFLDFIIGDWHTIKI